jgi:hypothetical protein
MMPQPQIQSANVVLRGHFSPAVFHPAWFASNDLLGRQEAEAAKVEIVNPHVAIFTAEWLQVNVVEDRFQAGTVQESHYEALRDLVIGVLDLLRHTPLRAMGLNRDFHYSLQSEQVWHSVGHRLVPKQDWEDVLETPGMRSLIVEGKRPDHLDGYIQVKVEPSQQVEYGVFVNVNDHYELKSSDTALAGTDKAIQILTERWAESMQRSLTIAQKVASLGVSQ